MRSNRSSARWLQRRGVRMHPAMMVHDAVGSVFLQDTAHVRHACVLDQCRSGGSAVIAPELR